MGLGQCFVILVSKHICFKYFVSPLVLSFTATRAVVRQMLVNLGLRLKAENTHLVYVSCCSTMLRVSTPPPQLTCSPTLWWVPNFLDSPTPDPQRSPGCPVRRFTRARRNGTIQARQQCKLRADFDYGFLCGRKKKWVPCFVCLFFKEHLAFQKLSTQP